MSSIKIIHGSCIDQNVDAIVNAANKYLIPGDGICGAIYSKAGYAELNEACKKINTPLNVGEAVITPAFNIINTKYIIHAVGPDFGITPNAFDLLFKAYYSSLELLIKNNIHSISFPLISSGIFGGNLENPAVVSAEQCKKAYKKFIEENKLYEIDVLLCAYTVEEYNQTNDII